MSGTANIGTLRGYIEIDDKATTTLKGVASDFEAVGKKLDSIAGQMAKHGAILSATITAPLVLLGKTAISAGTDYIQTMNRVAAVNDSSAADFKRLQAAAIEWGQKTQFSAQEAAEAMLELGKAGFSTDETISALPTTLQLAAAANMSLGEAANLTANVMKTFGLQTKDLAHANDILAAAANSSTIDVTDLREAFKYVGPVASQTGVSLAEASAAMALMGDAGIKGSMAGTSLRNTITTLINPTKKEAELMEELGLKSVYANGKLMGLDQVIDTLRAHGANTAQVMALFGDRAGPAMAALIEKGGAALRTLTTDLDKADGSAKRMADASMKGLPGALEQMRGSIETASTALVQALEPALMKGANAIGMMADFATSKLIPAFQALPSGMQLTIIGALGVVAAFGPLMLALSGMLSLFSTIATTVSLVAGGLWTLGNTVPILTARLWLMEAAASTVGVTLAAIAWPIAALAAVGLGVYRVSQHMDELKQRLEDHTLAGFFGKGGGFWDNSIIGRLLGMSASVEQLERCFDDTTESIKRLKTNLSGALEAKNVFELTRAVRELSEAGGLGTSALEKVGAQAQQLQQAGAKLTPELANIVAWYERMHPAAKAAADGTTANSKAFEKLNDELSGKKLLEDAREYEQIVAKLGGVSKLTADEQKKLSTAYEAVIAKYKLLGPAGATIVSHFQALLDKVIVMPPKVRELESRVGGLKEALQTLGQVSTTTATPAMETLKQHIVELESRVGGLKDVLKSLAQVGTTEAAPSIKALQKEAKQFATDIGTLGQAFSNLAQVSGDSWGGIAKDIGTAVTAVGTVFTAFQGFDEKKTIGKLTAVASAFAAVAQAASAGGLQGVLGGAASGAAVGFQFGGAPGAVFGGVAGGAYGAYQAFQASKLSDDKRKDLKHNYEDSFVNPLERDNPVGSLGGRAEGIYEIGRALKMAGVDATKATALVAQFLKADTDAGLSDAIANINNELEVGKASMATLDATTQKYGFTLEEMGTSGLALKAIDEQAQTLYQDFSVLTAGGIETGMVVTKMKDSVNDFIGNALRMGAEVPEAMRPMLQRMVDMGLLLDENGDQITDLDGSGIKFTETMSEGFTRVEEAVEKMTTAIAKMLGITIDGADKTKDAHDKSAAAIENVTDKLKANAAQGQQTGADIVNSLKPVETAFEEQIPAAIERTTGAVLASANVMAEAFGDKGPEVIDESIAAIDRLSTAIGLIPDGEFTIMSRVVGDGSGVFSSLPAGHHGGLVTGSAIQTLHKGGPVQSGRVLPFLRSNEMMAKLLVGESVLTPAATQALGLDAIASLNRDPSAFLDGGYTGAGGGNLRPGGGDTVIRIENVIKLEGATLLKFVQKALNTGELRVPDRSIGRRTA